MSEDYSILIRKGIVRMPQWRMREPLDFALRKGEHLAIVGPNGGGKSMFVDILTGAHPLLPTAECDVRPNDIKYITFRDSYGAYDNTYFLQQRWNQTEIDETTPTVAEELERAFHMSGDDTEERRGLQQHLYELFGIDYLLDKYIILLSSGETRKFQLIKALLSKPSILIMDNPFIGLDVKARAMLEELLNTLANEGTVQIILVLSRTEVIPAFINKIVKVDDMLLTDSISADEIQTLDKDTENSILNLPYNNSEYHSDEIIQMNNVTIKYGNRTILKGLDWTVMNGEHWAIEGQNGSGKSTLLSLVCADNPQSYACDISLFGYRRGSGESIWDIKKHIGYVSPEMHRAYQKDMPVIRIVASGLKDSIGLYVTPKPEDYEACRFWLRVFGIEHLADKTFLKISSGEQRLVLLARAFVKDPELLILDEPLHGLDDRNRNKTKEIIETFCKRKNKTLIMVTHYQEELPPCIDHHLLLKKIEN